MARNRTRIGSLRASFPPSHMPGLTKAWTYGLMMTLLALMISSRGKGRCPIFGVPRGRREVLVTSVGDATPDHVAVLPGNTALLLVLSAAIGGFVLLMLAGPYWLAALALLPVAALILLWVRAMVPASDMHPIEVAPGVSLPVHNEASTSLAQTGLGAFLVANGTLFASLLFGLAFLSVVTSGAPPPASAKEVTWAFPGLGGQCLALVLAILVLRRSTAAAVSAGALIEPRSPRRRVAFGLIR